MSTSAAVHRLPDQLLEASFPLEGTPLPPRQEQHDQARLQIGEALLDHWENEDYLTTHALRSATGFACIPSTEQVLRSEPHTLEIAQAVARNMSDLASYILETAELNESGIEKRNNFGSILGSVAEIAVLGAFWKGTASGLRDERYYALPTTSEQDMSRIVDGYYTGIDIIVRKSGSPKDKRFIQVKNNLDHSAYSLYPKIQKRYRPDITVLSPAMLLDEGGARGYDLLEAVATDDKRKITRANRNMDATLANTAARIKQLRYPHLQATPWAA